MGRNRAILNWLLYESSSLIICLQVSLAPCCSSLPDFAYETGIPCSTLLIEEIFLFRDFFMNRSSGLETKNLCTCTRRGSVMQAMFPSCLHEQTTVEMVIYNFFKVEFHTFQLVLHQAPLGDLE